MGGHAAVKRKKDNKSDPYKIFPTIFAIPRMSHNRSNRREKNKKEEKEREREIKTEGKKRAGVTT